MTAAGLVNGRRRRVVAAVNASYTRLMSTAGEHPLFCDRCTTELHPGRGDFFVIRIEAVADPSPPLLDESTAKRSARNSMRELIDAAEDLTKQELMDQIYRRLTIYLCSECYRVWSENPSGS